MKLTLKRPISAGEHGVPISELLFREEICSGDLRGIKLSAINDPAVEDILKIAGRLCGQPDAVLNKLGPEDLGEVATAIYGFLQGGQKTGNVPSP